MFYTNIFAIQHGHIESTRYAEYVVTSKKKQCSGDTISDIMLILSVPIKQCVNLHANLTDDNLFELISFYDKVIFFVE